MAFGKGSYSAGTMSLYSALVRPLFFRFDPETAHKIAMTALSCVPFRSCGRSYLAGGKHTALQQTLWGVDFTHPVGLAAGFDKNGHSIAGLSDLGFSSLEIGTITAKAQLGNEQPRCFRLCADQSIINRMGIPNEGAETIAEHLQKVRKTSVVIGANIGTSTGTPAEEAQADQAITITTIAPHVSYLVVNVSCPNVQGFTGQQATEYLQPLLRNAKACVLEAAPACPVLVKVGPDLSDDALDALVDTGIAEGVQGFVVSNTSVTREGVSLAGEEIERIGKGGLSGAVIRERATKALARVARRIRAGAHDIPVIGVGGVDSADAAWEKIIHGASLVQVYTGYIYQGPTLMRRINKGLVKKLRANGFTHISEAVGSAL